MHGSDCNIVVYSTKLYRNPKQPLIIQKVVILAKHFTVHHDIVSLTQHTCCYFDTTTDQGLAIFPYCKGKY